MARVSPIKPDYAALRERDLRPATYLYRAGASHVKSFLTKATAEKSAQELFGRDEVTMLVLRGTATQAATSSPSWAGALAHTVIDDSIAAITSVSAAAALIGRGMRLDFAGAAQLKIPGHLVDASDAGGWVAEGQAIRVRNQRYNAGVTLAPRKLMVITTYSREMAASSNLEAISQSLITEATSLALDKALFSTTADDGTTPGGILHNATSVTPTTGGGLTALSGDIKALLGALVTLGAGRDPVFIANPQQAATMKLLASPLFRYPVLPSSALALGTVIVVEASSFVSAFGATPEFSTDQQMAIVMEDTSPPQDPMTGQSVKSLFQVDSIGLRMILRASWGMRAAPTDGTKAAVAYVAGATW
jgi:hypothetical protein